MTERELSELESLAATGRMTPKDQRRVVKELRCMTGKHADLYVFIRDFQLEADKLMGAVPVEEIIE